MDKQEFPKGILPVLPVFDIDKTVTYYTDILKFRENFKQKTPDGLSTDAQLALEGSTLMINLNPEKAPLEGGGVYLWVRLYDIDIDGYYKNLIDNKVTIVDAIKDQFWGDRSFVIKDCNNFHIAFNQIIKN